MLDLLFETSWEVCNKVGGIYAVLSTKAKTLHSLYKDNLIFIGPDVWSEANESPYFEESKTLFSDWRGQVVFPSGMKVRVGRWKVPGRPIAILVDYKSLFVYKNELYADMWNRYHVDSLHAYGDYDESCMFAYGAALVIESIMLYRRGQVHHAIAHFDEWITGMGLLYVKAHLQSVGTVFTTHATSIGRSICGNGKPLYDYMAGYNGDQMAEELNMQSKHSLEKAAAQQADAFTTVSDVTARECEQLLERRPLVTPNAFERNFVPSGVKAVGARETARRRLLQVADCLIGEHFAPDTMLVLTSGRSEYRNKGLDVTLDAINATRDQLNLLSMSARKVLAFVMVPGWIDGPRHDLAQAVADSSSQRLFNPVVTHNLHMPEADAIYGRINNLGLFNDISDNLKIIYVPCYLNGNDGIFNMSYYQLLIGFDLSLFPSYYEPWGYTPLESVAFGVPTITSDLSGFGQWTLNTCGSQPMQSGVKVVHRTDSNYRETVANVAGSIVNVYSMKAPEARRLTKAAQNTSKLASWQNFMSCYDVAYTQALQKAELRMISDDDGL